jgi:multidrug resistance efflux pump
LDELALHSVKPPGGKPSRGVRRGETLLPLDSERADMEARRADEQARLRQDEARRGDEATRLQQDATRRADEATRVAQEAARRAAELEAELARMRAGIERPRRRSKIEK